MRCLYAYDVVQDLRARGWARISTEASQEALTDAAVAAGATLDATSVGVKVLNGDGDTEWLPRHTENLTDPTPVRYFALGCVKAAPYGGQTCLYDGRAAARALLAAHPELMRVRITYATKYRPDTATHPLIINHDGAESLRYRSRLPTNMVFGSLPDGMNQSNMYTLVESALTEATVLAYEWAPGDLVIVDNARMIHARAPYTGTRTMVRYRYDDPHFQTVMITQ